MSNVSGESFRPSLDADLVRLLLGWTSGVTSDGSVCGTGALGDIEWYMMVEGCSQQKTMTAVSFCLCSARHVLR